MTDLQKFIELYKSLGIDLKPYEFYDNVCIRLTADGCYYDEDDTYSDKFVGWNGFYSNLVFDKNGKFIKQEFLE